MKSIRMVTWLAPGIPLAFFEKVRETLQERLGVPVSLGSRTKLSGPVIGSRDPFGEGLAELGFLCAPATVPAPVRGQAGFDLLGLAPLFDDDRYEGHPRCYCDLVVRGDVPAERLEDLQGMTFGYNDSSSLSGWLGLTSALSRRHTSPEAFFGELVRTGGHLSSLEGLRNGSIQVASIDSNVHRSHAGALDGLRVVDSVGPWPSQPVVVRGTLDGDTRAQLREALSTCGPWPSWGFIGFRPQQAADLDRVPTASLDA
jgi:hypothetical protein